MIEYNISVLATAVAAAVTTIHNASDTTDTDLLECDVRYSSVVQRNLRIISLVTIVLAFVIGLAGNGLVLLVIIRNKAVRQKSVANYYILNLALADLLFTSTLPFFFSAAM